MSKQFYITNYVKIKDRSIFNKKDLIFKSDLDPSEIDLFLKEAYNFFQISYPKFFKMDRISKLGILASDLLFQQNIQDNNTALIFANSTSSLNTDKIHQNAINQIVSPSVFVYTLPNIVLGEISIKHKLQSENAFFISETFDPDLLYNYSNVILQSGKAKNAVCGWIDLEKCRI